MCTRTNTALCEHVSGQSHTIRRHTLGVFIVRLLEVLDDTLLADELLNLALGLDVEGVLVEQGNLVLALTLGVLGGLLPHGEGFSPAAGVVDGGGELGVPLAQLGLGLGVHKELLSHALGVGLANARRVGRTLGLLHGRPVLADEHRQHLAIAYARGLEGLSLDDDGLAVEVDALGGGGQAGLSLNEALEVLDGAGRGQLEGQQLVVGLGARGGDGYGDAGPLGAEVSRGCLKGLHSYGWAVKRGDSHGSFGRPGGSVLASGCTCCSKQARECGTVCRRRG
ncbi:hypothetical protein DE146DRAFT_226264 [Phaeosphaeria sp. MPI-PUGE-AT-0046c]|nr:hypothetical protein DE146DRAFT_226264 [Phaeosphaeria sp. MPI-PUGE-AT-0046c]